MLRLLMILFFHRAVSDLWIVICKNLIPKIEGGVWGE
jgi:hypothetical protein